MGPLRSCGPLVSGGPGPAAPYLLALLADDLFDARHGETGGLGKLLDREQPSTVEAADLRVEPLAETLEFLGVCPVRFGVRLDRLERLELLAHSLAQSPRAGPSIRDTLALRVRHQTTG
jgi:hypothetical protein